MKIMKIVNISPESFSGDGIKNEEIFDKLNDLITENVDIYDIGGQSTKPGYTEISAQEEWERVNNVINFLNSKDKVMSIDSYKLPVIEKALASGVKIINNVAHYNDEEKKEIIKLMKKYDAQLVIMHPFSADNIDEIKQYLFNEVDFYVENGIDSNKLILDPGYGYGKSDELLMQIYKDMSVFKYLNSQTLIGLSRKSSIQRIFNLNLLSDLDKLDELSYKLSVESKADIIRIHKVQ